MSSESVHVTREAANRAWLERYIEAISGQPKTEALMHRFTTDESLIAHVQASEAAFPGYHMLIDDVIAEGDKLVIRARGQGRHEGEFAGIAPTGREVEFPAIIIYRLENDKVAEFWMQADMMGLVRQISE